VAGTALGYGGAVLPRPHLSVFRAATRGGVGGRDDVKDRRRVLRQARTWADLSIIGIQFPVAIAIGFFWGRWLDRTLGTWPYLTAVFSLFGIVAGFINLFRITAKAARDEQELTAEDEQSSETSDDRLGNDERG